MASTITPSGSNTVHTLMRAGIAADGHLSLLGQNMITVAGDNIVAAPVTFSGDGLHVYMAIPTEAVSAFCRGADAHVF